MNKYIYSVCGQESWPEVYSVIDVGINEAEEQVINKYCDLLEIENNNFDYLEFQEKLNEDFNIVISDLYDIEEL